MSASIALDANEPKVAESPSSPLSSTAPLSSTTRILSNISRVHWDAAVITLCAAFQHDPVMTYLWRKDQYRMAGAATFFAFMLSTQYQEQFSFHLSRPSSPSSSSSSCDAVAMWQAPGHSGLPLSQMLRMAGIAPSVFGITGVLRALQLGSLVDAVHPHEHHYYLGFVAVHPHYQGQGFLRKVLKPILDKADAEDLPCYLENSNPKNTPMYEKLGFVGRSVITSPPIPPILAMWREKKSLRRG